MARQPRAGRRARRASTGSRIGIEPLNRYETSLVNTVEQALTALGATARAVASGWPSTPTTSTSRSARQRRRRTPRPASTSSTSRSAATTAAPRAATRPTGRRSLAALDDIGYDGPLEHRELHPGQRLDRRRRLDLAAAGRLARRPGRATGSRFLRCRLRPEVRDERLTPAARRRRRRLLVHGQGALQRLAQRRRLLPRHPAGAPAGARRPRRARGQGGRAAGTAGPRSTTDWRAVIERDDIDIVDICTPGHLHAEIALAALAAGKHVLVEKPLANSVAESERWWPPRRTPPPRGVSVDGRLQLPPGAGARLARALIERGPDRRGPAGAAATSRTGWPTRGADDLAAAQGDRRLRARSATSGSHVVDQLHYLLGEPVTAANGHLHTFVDRARRATPGPSRSPSTTPPGRRCETAAGVVASLEVSRMATGRKNGLQHRGLRHRRLARRSTCERLNELRVVRRLEGGATARGGVLVTERRPPVRRPPGGRPGHVLGWDHTFTSQAADFLTAIATGDRARPVLRGRPRRAAGARRDRGECGTGSGARVDILDAESGGDTDGQALHPVHRPVGRPHPRGGRRAGRRLGLRRPRDRRLRRAPRRVALGRRRLHRGAARHPAPARPAVSGRSPTT